MTTDIFGRVLFNDGEAIDPDDLTGVGSRVLAMLYDQIMASGVPDPTGLSSSLHDPDFNENAIPVFIATGCPFALALTAHGARPWQLAAHNKVRITRGTLLQAIANPSGAEPQLLAYYFDGGTDGEVTIAAGDVSNPRVDILQMKLEYVNDTATSRDFQDAVSRALTTTTPNKRRRVKCTLSVKQGTPAASPTYPTLDAGCCAVAGVVVGTNWVGAAAFANVDTAGANAVIHDQRVPISIDVENVQPREMLFLEAGWAPTDGIYPGVVTALNPNYIIYALSRSSSQGRLLQISATSGLATTTGYVAKIVRWTLADALVSGPASPAPVDLAGVTGFTGGGTSFIRRLNTMREFVHSPSAGPTVIANAAGIGAPVWTSGRRCPADTRTLSNTAEAFECLCFSQTKSTANWVVGPVTFWIARGL